MRRPPEIAVRAEKALAIGLPAILILLVVYLICVLGLSIQRPWLHALEWLLIGYFIAELLVKWCLAETWRAFFKQNWLHILLILPLLRIARVFAALGLATNAATPALRSLPYAQKLAKIPLLAKKVRSLILAALAAKSIRNRGQSAKANTRDGD